MTLKSFYLKINFIDFKKSRFSVVSLQSEKFVLDQCQVPKFQHQYEVAVRIYFSTTTTTKICLTVPFAMSIPMAYSTSSLDVHSYRVGSAT